MDVRLGEKAVMERQVLNDFLKRYKIVAINWLFGVKSWPVGGWSVAEVWVMAVWTQSEDFEGEMSGGWRIWIYRVSAFPKNKQEWLRFTDNLEEEKWCVVGAIHHSTTDTPSRQELVTYFIFDFDSQ